MQRDEPTPSMASIGAMVVLRLIDVVVSLLCVLAIVAAMFGFEPMRYTSTDVMVFSYASLRAIWRKK